MTRAIREQDLSHQLWLVYPCDSGASGSLLNGPNTQIVMHGCPALRQVLVRVSLSRDTIAANDWQSRVVYEHADLIWPSLGHELGVNRSVFFQHCVMY